ncbi:MAG TPA: hypothetical protein PKK15_13785 [Kouleothrix sp.]|mgnify:CR=1 FL=1|uniref:hypothetical protein n=1 Tax=Kouleothrix sp. TaxID=2779161 RepID=UPI002B92B6B7|nr:hypothetical protein [Kouleothrix sp.]
MEHNPVTTPQAGEPLALLDTPDERAELPVSRPSSRRYLEPAAIGVMALGFVMMFQPFAKPLFTYSFIVILLGTLMFIVVSHLPE